MIVHKEFLLQQWTERINQLLPTAQVGRIQGDIVDIELEGQGKARAIFN